jgi:hypothetical protein
MPVAMTTSRTAHRRHNRRPALENALQPGYKFCTDIMRQRRMSEPYWYVCVSIWIVKESCNGDEQWRQRPPRRNHSTSSNPLCLLHVYYVRLFFLCRIPWGTQNMTQSLEELPASIFRVDEWSRFWPPSGRPQARLQRSYLCTINIATNKCT